MRRQESDWTANGTATTTTDATCTKAAATGRTHVILAIIVGASAALTWRLTANGGATVLLEGYGTAAVLESPIRAPRGVDVVLETYGGTSATKAVSMVGYTR